MKPEEMRPHYHRPESCNKCGSMNNEQLSGSFTDGEIKTKCKDCGHDDYWSYGFFNSEIEPMCKKYVNMNGKLVNI